MEQTPLFQLNLMIWLTWPAPPGGIVHPIFREDDFALQAIGPAFELPLDIRARVRAAGIPSKERPSPDLLLAHHQRRLFVPLECKVSSFGPHVPPGNKKHQARQAAALLSATGPYLSDYLGLPEPANWQAYLLYAVSGSQEAAMQATLGHVGTRLLTARIDSTPAGALGIHIQDDGVYLKPALETTAPIIPLQAAPPHGVRVVELKDGEDPRLPYLLPWDPSIGPASEYERRVLEERVRSALASLIGSRLDAPTFDVSLDEILLATVEVWELWQDRRAATGLRNAVRSYVRRVLAELRKQGVDIQIHQNTFSFAQAMPQAAQEVRRYLNSASFRRGEIDLWSEAVQLDFSSLAAGW
jgi:hypothetical protein